MKELRELNEIIAQTIGIGTQKTEMRSYNLSFEAAGRESRAKRRPTKFHMCSIGYISGE